MSLLQNKHRLVSTFVTVFAALGIVLFISILTPHSTKQPVEVVHAAPTTVTSQSAEDNTLDGNPGGDDIWNRGGYSLFNVGLGNTTNRKVRALIKFDLSSISLPAGATVTSASLTLNCTSAYAGNAPSTIHAYKLLTPWNEGNATSFIQNSASSWVYSNYPTTWQTGGASGANDRNPTSLGNLSVTACANTKLTWNLDSAAVQGWLSDPTQNLGIILVGDEATLNTIKVFSSSEDTTPGNRPTLSITYDSGVGGPVCGNSVIESGEQCDGSSLGGASCTSRGFSGGTLSCLSCQFVTSACTQTPTQTCGNGIIEGTEQCDGSNLGNASCTIQGFSGGTLSCLSCQLVTSACMTPTPSSGTFHVRTDGNDATCNGNTNASSSSAPNCAFKTIQKAVNSLASAGNRIIIHTGTYPEYVQIGASQPNGTAQNPIIIEGDSSVPRTSIIVDGSAFDGTFLVNGTGGSTTKTYYIFQHFSFRTGRSQGMELGTFTNGLAANMVARDLEVHSINFVQTVPYNSRVITASTWASGPYGNNGNMLIEDVVIDNAENGGQVASGDGIFATSGHTTVRRTNIKDVKAFGRVGNAATLEFNTWEFSDCNSDGGCIQLYNNYGLVMRYNTVKVKNSLAAGAGGRVMETRCCAAGTSLSSSPDFASALIYNNVFDYQGTAEATAIRVDHGSQYVSIRNNIFKGFRTTSGSSGVWSPSGSNCAKYEFKYNALYSSSLNRSTTGCGSTLDPTNLADTATIDFNTGTYTPNAGSRLINSGDPTLSIPVGGGTRSDIGAYESGAGTTWPYDFQIRDTTTSNLPILDWGNNSAANITIAPPYGFSSQTGFQCQIDSTMTFNSQGFAKPLYDSGAPNSSSATMCQSNVALPNGNYFGRVRFSNEVSSIASYAGVWSDHYYSFSIGSASAPVCGNGVVESGEQCDGANLSTASCVSLGFAGGTLSCLSCQFVTNQCTQPTFSTYHVRTDGSDTACNGGTNASAASTPNCAFKTIQKGINAMIAGNTILVHAGTYGGPGTMYSGDNLNVLGLINGKSGGSASQRYTIQAAPNETVILDGASSGILDTAFFINNAPYVSIIGFRIANFTGRARGTVHIEGSSNGADFSNNTIQGSTNSAGEVHLNGNSTITIRGNSVSSNAAIVFFLSNYSGQVAVTNSEISNNTVVQTKDANNPLGNLRAIFVVRSSGVKVLNNYIQNADSAKNGDSYAMYIRDNSDVTVQGNIITEYMQEVVFQDSGPADGVTGTDGQNQEERHLISNNTFDGSGVPNDQVISMYGSEKSCDGCVFASNILMGFDTGWRVDNNDPAAFPSTTLITKNVYYAVTRHFIIAPDVTQTGDITTTSLPVIGNGTLPAPHYELATGSQAINAGSNTYCAWMPSDGQCDAGAYEFTTTSVIDLTPPVISNALPTGALAVGTTQVTLSVSTDEAATCKYGTVANTDFASLPSTFSATGGTVHSATLTGLTNGSNYHYFIRCQDTHGNANQNDFNISFTVTVNTTPTQCTEQWACSAWSVCANGTQSRTCTDQNSCGTTTQRPTLIQSCSIVSGGGGGTSTPSRTGSGAGTQTTQTTLPPTNSQTQTPAQSAGSNNLTPAQIQAIIDSAKQRLTTIDRALVQRLLGRILLQVQDHGEAWYLDPLSKVRYYLANGSEAYQALRQFGLGITDADLAKIPVGIEDRFQDTDSDGDGLADRLEEGIGSDPNKADSDNDGYPDRAEIENGYSPIGPARLPLNSAFVNRLRGRILLQVQKQGQAWYLSPMNGKRYYLRDGDAAYQIMRFLSLGITNTDLNKINIGTVTGVR